MNILLTNECNRRCTYCFAQERVRLRQGSGVEPRAAEAPRAPRFIARDDFSKAIRFAQGAAAKVVGILGGEPSLHPEFVALLEEAWGLGLHTKVFTNALWRASDLERVARLRDSRESPLRVVVNVNEPSRTPPAERSAQETLLEALGPVSTLSCNISRVDLEFDYLLELMLRYATRRHLRLGMAEPLAELGNEHLEPEEYPLVSEKIVRFAESADRHGIVVGFDCGFTLCMFDDRQLGRLVQSGTRFRARCGPAIDVGTDLAVWACFPLSALSRGERLHDFASLAELSRHFRTTFRRLYHAGALPECLSCRHRARRRCAGGCAAHVYRRYQA